MPEVPKHARIFVAGHRGLVGSAILRRLATRPVTRTSSLPRRDQLDLRDQAAVNYWFRANRPEYVFLVAGTVGGILANSTRPGGVPLRQHDDPRHGGARGPPASASKKLLYLGSSCIYPRDGDAADQRGRSCSPVRSSRPTRRTRSPRSPASSCARPTARQYGCNFISAMPTNLYGPNDNFDLDELARPARR